MNEHSTAGRHPASDAQTPGKTSHRRVPLTSVASWVLYDLANTIFSMGVVTLYFPEWVGTLLSHDTGAADKVAGWTTSISMAVIFFISPIIGAMTDRARKRMPFLIISTLICVGFTLLLGRAGYTGTLIAFVIANAAYQAGLQFYDSLLVEVSNEENRGRIGGIGVGVGYFGSFIAVGFGLIFKTADHTLLFTLVGIAFLAFAIPCFLFVRERGNPHPGKVFDLDAIARSTRETIATLRQGEKYPGLLRFLLGRVFYTDAINTVIFMMVLFAQNVARNEGLNNDEARMAARMVMFSAISFAIIGGFAWGRVVDRIGPKRTLNLVLYLWMATFTLACAIGFLGLSRSTLLVVGIMAGIGLGGVLCADRPLMLRLTPPDRIGEFYGLYGMVGRFSAIIGPALWAIVVPWMVGGFGMTGLSAQAVGLTLLLAMVLISYVILQKVDDTPRDWKKLGAS